jgi:predicted ArsR family transcriptional regulator
LPISRHAVSQHLKVLKLAGLVTDHPVGTRRVYRLDPDGVSALRTQLARFWTQALTTYKEIVEQSTEEDLTAHAEQTSIRTESSSRRRSSAHSRSCVLHRRVPERTRVELEHR